MNFSLGNGEVEGDVPRGEDEARLVRNGDVGGNALSRRLGRLGNGNRD